MGNANRVWAAVAAGAASLALGCATPGGQDSSDAARKAASHVELGVDHMANGRSALALREFLAAEKLDPKNARVHYALGDAYLARGKRADAERHWRRSLELYPDFHDSRQSLTALLLVDQRYEEAIEECDRLIDDPTYATPWACLTNRGWAEFKLGRAEAARQTLALAREYRQEYWPATLALARVESETGHRSEAIRLFQEIIAQSPGAIVESEVNYHLAEIYVALGKRQQAMGHLTASVARAPEGPWAKKSQETLKKLH